MESLAVPHYVSPTVECCNSTDRLVTDATNSTARALPDSLLRLQHVSAATVLHITSRYVAIKAYACLSPSTNPYFKSTCMTLFEETRVSPLVGLKVRGIDVQTSLVAKNVSVADWKIKK